MRNLLRALVASALFTYASGTAQAIELLVLPDRPDSVVLSGGIETGDEAKLRDVLGQQYVAGTPVTYLVLDSPGGNVGAGIEMAALVRKLNIKTVVDGDDECSSACMIIFAAGTERFVWQGAMLGVHNARSYVTGADADDGTVYVAKAMSAYGTPPAVLGQLVATTSDSMAYLTPEDVEGWVKVIYPQEQVAQQFVAPERAVPAEPVAKDVEVNREIAIRDYSHLTTENLTVTCETGNARACIALEAR